MWQKMRRPLKRLAVAATAAALSLVLVSEAGSRWPLSSTRVMNIDVRQAAAISALPTTVGVAEGADLHFMSEPDVKRTFDVLQALGVKNVRVAIMWAVVEPDEGSYDWAQLDLVVAEATKRGMGILGNINHTPDWAGSPVLTGHPDPQTYGEFVSAVAQRYAGKISAYEIWNEPTGNIFWDPVDPAAYTELLKAGYRAIKDVDTSIMVIGGSVVAGPTRADGSTMDPVSFVQGMYDAGAQGHFDALSYHPYLYSTSFSEGNGKPVFDYPIEQLFAIRNLMIAKGDGNLKVWITEYGQPTITLADGTVYSEAQQSAYIADLIRTWQSVDGAGPVFIYNTRDTQTGSVNPDYNLGLYYSNWAAKPAAQVLADLISELSSPAPEPVNPVIAFFQQIVSAITSVLSFIPNLIGQVVRAVVNFVGGLFGIPPSSAAAPRSAEPAAVTADDASEPEQVSRSGFGAQTNSHPPRIETDDVDVPEEAAPVDVPEAAEQTVPTPDDDAVLEDDTADETVAPEETSELEETPAAEDVTPEPAAPEAPATAPSVTSGPEDQEASSTSAEKSAAGVPS